MGVETIRFYQRLGLLPRPPQPLSGWREYGEDAVVSVRYIRLAQNLGFTLDEIKQLGQRLYGAGNFCRDFRAALEHKLRETEGGIERLMAVKGELQRTLFSCVTKADRGECPIMKRFPSRAVGRRVGRRR